MLERCPSYREFSYRMKGLCEPRLNFFTKLTYSCTFFGHVHFHVLNNLENAASLNYLLSHEIFQSASKWKTRSSYLGEPNSMSYIETRHTKLDKAVCIYAIFSHI